MREQKMSENLLDENNRKTHTLCPTIGFNRE